MKALFGVPERVARQLAVGQPLALHLETRADPLPGRVTAIAPAADAQSRVFAVEVTVENPDRELRAGTISTVRVPAAGAVAADRAVAAVPLGAVVRSPARQDG